MITKYSISNGFNSPPLVAKLAKASGLKSVINTPLLAAGCFIFFLTLLLTTEVTAAPLSWPIQVRSVQLYDDGGSIGYVTTDAKDQTFLFCLDRRLQTSTYNSIYLNTLHPKREGAKLLEKNTRTEKDFLTHVKSSLDIQFGLIGEKEILKKYKKDQTRSELEIGIAVLLSIIDERYK